MFNTPVQNDRTVLDVLKCCVLYTWFCAVFNIGVMLQVILLHKNLKVVYIFQMLHIY